MTLTAFIYAIPWREAGRRGGEGGVGATQLARPDATDEGEDNGNAKKTVAVPGDDRQRPLARPDAFVSRPCVGAHTWTSRESQ